MKPHDHIALKGIWKFTIKDAATGRVKRVQEYENLVVAAGLSAIASAVASELTDIAAIEINYTSLGTGTTAPAAGDTQLQTETYRKLIASLSEGSGIVYATAFYTATEVTGTFREAGIHLNGTASANTGTLLSRVAINVVKTSAETLTIDYTLTFAAA